MPVHSDTASATASSRNDQEQFNAKLARFDVKNARCAKDEDTQRLLACIVSSPARALLSSCLTRPLPSRPGLGVDCAKPCCCRRLASGHTTSLTASYRRLSKRKCGISTCRASRPHPQTSVLFSPKCSKILLRATSPLVNRCVTPEAPSRAQVACVANGTVGGCHRRCRAHHRAAWDHWKRKVDRWALDASGRERHGQSGE